MHNHVKPYMKRWIRNSGRTWREDAGYGTSGWQATKNRAATLLRDGYKCVECGHQADPDNMKPRELFADHIKPVARGGTSNPRNMQTLCESCHTTKTYEEIEQGKRLARARDKQGSET